MPHITVNGATLYYEDTGSGSETLVFMHGLGWSGRMFDPQIERFAPSYRCINIDLRGHGGSELTAGGYEMESLADDAAAIIEKLGAAPCHFVGWSIGGFIGLRLAARKPALLRTLTLIGASEPSGAETSFSFKLLPYLITVLGPTMVTGNYMAGQFSQSYLKDPRNAQMVAELRRRFQTNRRQGIVRAATAVISQRPLGAELAKIRLPVLVINGDADTIIAPAAARATAEKVRGAKFVAVSGGHACNIESGQAEIRAKLGGMRKRV